MKHQSDDYDKINLIAHRRLVPVFHAPTLTWHRAFWIKDLYERIEGHPKVWLRTLRKLSPKNAPQEYTSPQRHIREYLDYIIINIYSALEKHAESVELHPRIENSPQANDATIFLFSMAMSSKAIGIALDMATLSEREKDLLNNEGRVVTIRYTMNHIKMKIRIELRSEYFCISTFASFIDDNESSDLYFGKIDVAGFSNMYMELKDFLSGKNADIKQEISEYFYIEFWDKFIRNIQNISGTPSLFQSRAFKNVFVDFRGIIISNETVGNKIALKKDIDDGTWGYLIDDKLRRVLHHTDKYEVVASYALQKRALYMSTLGTQPQKQTADLVFPLEFIVFIQQGEPSNISRGVNKWQLGRLIDRLHVMGTVRLAALKYYPQLLKVGSGLSRLDAKVSAARRVVYKPDQNTEERIRNSHAEFDKLTSIFNRTTITSSGILYRVERSRYYVAQFHKNISFLKLETIGGYQKYDKFIERRLGPTFDFIDRLGKRYERAVTSLSTLDQLLMSIKTNNLENDIRTIQLGGEYALLVALLPYYLISIISEIANETFVPYATMFIWIPLIVWFVWRRVENSQAGKHKRILITIIAAIVLQSVAYLGYRFRNELPLHIPHLQTTEHKAHNEELEEQWISKRVEKQDDMIKAQRELLEVQKKILELQQAAQEKRATPDPSTKKGSKNLGR